MEDSYVSCEDTQTVSSETPVSWEIKVKLGAYNVQYCNLYSKYKIKNILRTDIKLCILNYSLQLNIIGKGSIK